MLEKKSAYERLLRAFGAIAREEVKTPNMPVDVYVQEANDLFLWATQDKPALTGAGLSWDLVEGLTERADALSQAQTIWQEAMFGREEAQDEWNEKSPAGFELRDELVHFMRFAYRSDQGLTTVVRKIAEGRGDADMIQDLNDLSGVGLNNPEPLKSVGMDLSLLEKAASLSKELGMLRADASMDKAKDREVKDTRDRAYTYLKQAVDAVRDHGQFVFWKNDERRVGYASDYLRQSSSKPARTAETSQNGGQTPQ